MDKYTIYMKKFQIALGIFALSLIVFIFLVSKVIPEVQKISQIQNDYKTQSSALADSERKLQDLKDAARRKEAENENIQKIFFKPISEGLDTEAAISDEFGEILQIVRENKIKMRSVKYDYDPQDDNFVKNAGNRYQVCRVTAEMIASYSNFANFLRELYKHEHFLEISKIEIAPYEKNKRILLISLQIKLYAQRDPSTVVETPAPAANSGDGQADASGNATPPSPTPASAEGGVSPEAAQ
ncbi:unknown [Clostridium sp. CAG:768]|nr:unknown [Clostridium sp. CAG:768]